MHRLIAVFVGLFSLVGTMESIGPAAWAQSVAEKKPSPNPNQRLADEIRRKFPLVWEGGSGRIDGNSWRFEKIRITLSVDGRLNVTAMQTTNRLEGFTGAMVFEILDQSGNILAIWQPPATGVDGRIGPFSSGKRNVRHAGQVAGNVILGAHKIRLQTALHTGSKGRLERNIANIDKIMKQISSMGAEAAKVAALLGG